MGIIRNNTEIINLVVDYVNNNSEKLIFFLKDDCVIDFNFKYINYKMFHSIKILNYKIEYKNKLSTKIFEVHEVKQIHINHTKYILEQYKADDILLGLIPILDDDDYKKIYDITYKDAERKKVVLNNNQNINVSPIFNNTNNILNENNNISNIKTYSDLRSFVENNTNIENKTEIVNLIRELEESKEDEKKEDYIDKFLELLELLGNVVPIPPAIIKGAKTAKKFFDSVRGKNEK